MILAPLVKFAKHVQFETAGVKFLPSTTFRSYVIWQASQWRGKFLESVLPLETLWIQLDLKHCTDLCTVGSLIGNIYTMWKFQDIYPTHILREINFGHFEAQKTAILTIWAGLNFEFLGTFDTFKCDIFLKIKIQSFQKCKYAIFWPKISQNCLHVKSEWQENC